jgi:hypothetical protein
VRCHADRRDGSADADGSSLHRQADHAGLTAARRAGTGAEGQAGAHAQRQDRHHQPGRQLVLDHSTVEKFGVEQVRLYEPWTKENLDFRGVWLDDLLAVAGAKPDATKVHIVALDDYAVDLNVADIRTGGIMLATRAGDGSMLPIDKGGPIRVVFADGVPAGQNPDQWIWSLKSIDVQ